MAQTSHWTPVGVVGGSSQEKSASAQSGMESVISRLTLLPSKYSLTRLNESELRSDLPVFFPQDGAAKSTGTASEFIDVPFPDGSLRTLAVTRYQMMEAGIASQYPEIATFKAQDVQNPHIRGHLSMTPLGFHGLLLTDVGAIYIEPRLDGDERYYVSYYDHDYFPRGKEGGGICLNDEHTGHPAGKNFDAASIAAKSVEKVTFGTYIKQYRIAVAATAEYTAFQGSRGSGTPTEDALAAIITSINRVNLLYEVELATRFVVIDDNDDIIFTNSATDGLTDGNPSAMIGELPDILLDPAILGWEKFDVGHGLGTNSPGFSSGIASVGVVCAPGDNNSFFARRKARGASTSWRPINDSFDIELLAHELGHQMGSSHTFNGVVGNCAAQRSATFAVEPGSGSTIMSYAGICGSDNLQSDPDYMFSTRSQELIDEEFRFGWGDLCEVRTNVNENAAPVVVTPAGFNMPANTPFELTGSATDADGDALTYSWEQIDRGGAAAVDIDNGDNPIIRALPPANTPTRVIPNINSLLTGNLLRGEILPQTSRTLTFRLTARDGNGGIDSGDTVLTVTNTSANGFRVTNLNTSQTFSALTPVNLTWDVASTNQSPINCSSVDVYFSSDGGVTFPVSVITGTPNDGSQSVVVPNINTSDGRFKVKCSDSVFFDINDADLTIDQASEIQVEGNSVEISDGDTSPTESDHTDFGSALADGGILNRTFTVRNVGSLILNLTGNQRVTLSGDHAADFTVTSQPGTPVSIGGSSTFVIRFDPSALGSRNATVTIASDDGDENPYTFAISGQGSAPEIRVMGNSLEIVDGDATPRTQDWTDFGAVNADSGTRNNNFVIDNQFGTAPLSLSGNPRVVIGGTNAGDFQVTQQPPASVPASGSESFTIQFNPSAIGLRSATVSIANNDDDENPYNFSVQGTGTGVDVSLDVTDVEDPVNAGATVTYQVTVSNGGPNSAQNVQVNTTLDASLASVSSTGCAESPGNATSCTLGAIASGSSSQFTLTAQLSQNERVSVSSQFAVQTTSTDTDNSNDTDGETTVVSVVAPDFALIASPVIQLLNELVVLTFEIDNSDSLISANSAGFNLNLPAGLEIAPEPAVISDCVGSVTAQAGAAVISLTNGAVAPSSECSISVNVTSSVEALFELSTSDLVTTSGNSGSASRSVSFVEEIIESLCFPVRTVEGDISVICM
ncbi:MAG: choice-of-anchor D domain-containing protein [Pseudomonadota bacterium]